MRVLTLWQPWATLVALGVKTIETRPQLTDSLIMGDGLPEACDINEWYKLVHLHDGRAVVRECVRDGIGFAWRPRGDVTGQLSYGHFAPGRHALLLTDVQPLAVPVPFKGGQGWSRSIDDALLQ